MTEVPIFARRYLYIEMDPWSSWQTRSLIFQLPLIQWLVRIYYKYENIVVFASIFYVDLSFIRSIEDALSNMSTWTKWPLFRRRCIQMYFHERKFCVLEQMSLYFVPKGPADNKSVLLWEGLVPSRRQTSIWANVDPVYWRVYAVLRSDDLIRLLQNEWTIYMWRSNKLHIMANFISGTCQKCIFLPKRYMFHTADLHIVTIS